MILNNQIHLNDFIQINENSYIHLCYIFSTKEVVSVTTKKQSNTYFQGFLMLKFICIKVK